MSQESLDTLARKSQEASISLATLSQLRRRGLPRTVTLLYRLCEGLPLGLIPVTLTWTGIVFFLPVTEPLTLIRVYALGLLAMLLIWAALWQARTLVGTWRLADGILGEIAQLPGLAYHPNATLRRQLVGRGWVTFGEFRDWAEKQRQILETRRKDYEVAVELAKHPSLRADLRGFPPGARAFLES